jgi:hypothetical protein
MRLEPLLDISWSMWGNSVSEAGELLAELMMATLARSENCSLWRRGGRCPAPEDVDGPPSSRGIRRRLSQS